VITDVILLSMPLYLNIFRASAIPEAFFSTMDIPLPPLRPRSRTEAALASIVLINRLVPNYSWKRGVVSVLSSQTEPVRPQTLWCIFLLGRTSGFDQVNSHVLFAGEGECPPDPLVYSLDRQEQYPPKFLLSSLSP